jgi:pimeloyl-ACP methyl ester carboxylesterase
MHWRQYQELQKVAELGDRFISYVEAGQGPAVVLLHGTPTWGFLFHRLLPVLERRHRVLIPDLPGYGFSDRSDRFGRSVARQAERLAAWLHAIGVDKASFVGHELGGAVALHHAAHHPERVDRLCLVDSVAYDSFPIPLVHHLGQPHAARTMRGPSVTKRLARALEPGFSRPEPELLAGLLAPYSTDVGRLSLARDAAALDCNETMELTGALPRLRIPTLVVWGENDPFQPVSIGRRLAWDLPNAELAVIPGASHFCLVDRPAEVSGRLTQFLDGSPAMN